MLADTIILVDPEFPPALNGIAVDAGEDPFARSAAGAKDGRYGAGDFLWSMRSDAASAAVVLEPEVPAAKALQMVPVMMVAIGDALGAIGPPKLALTFRWPGTVLANGARAGGVRAALPDGIGDDEVPDWMIVAFELQLEWSGAIVSEPGQMQSQTVLYEEGCGDLDRTAIVEAVSRHFLSHVDGWEQDGFATAHQSWTGKAHDENGEVELLTGSGKIGGEMVGLDEGGGLLVKEGGKPRLITLREALDAGMLS